MRLTSLYFWSIAIALLFSFSRGHGETLAVEDYKKSGKFGEVWGDGIPIAIDAAAMDRGKNRYMAYCAVCHGMNGVSTGGPTVTSLLDPRVRALPDGEVFQVVTAGRNTMLGFGPALTESDRWKIVAYVRALQRSRGDSSSAAPIPISNAVTQEIDALKQKAPAPVKDRK